MPHSIRRIAPGETSCQPVSTAARFEHGLKQTARCTANRFVVVVLLLIALPTIVVAGFVHGPWGRRVALAFIRTGCWMTRVRVVMKGTLEHESGPYVYVANHSSPFDIAALLLARPDLTFVAGADLFRTPLLAGAMRALGTIPVDRRSGRGVRLHVPARQVSPGLSLAVFPEGGIAPAGERRSFRHGAFALAIELRATVVPVAIHGSSRVLPPRSRLGVRPGRVVVEILDSMHTDELRLDDRASLANRAQQNMLRALGPDDGGVAGR